MLHDSILGVELLLRQFQNIFAWWMKWKNLDHYVNIFFAQVWNEKYSFEILDYYVIIMDYYVKFCIGLKFWIIMWSLWNEKYIIWHRFLEQVDILILGLKAQFFYYKKICFFFNISNRPNWLNRTAIGSKTDPRWCALVPIMKKPISIGSVINLEKNRPYRTAHTPIYKVGKSTKMASHIFLNEFETLLQNWCYVPES